MDQFHERNVDTSSAVLLRALASKSSGDSVKCSILYRLVRTRVFVLSERSFEGRRVGVPRLPAGGKSVRHKYNCHRGIGHQGNVGADRLVTRGDQRTNARTGTQNQPYSSFGGKDSMDRSWTRMIAAKRPHRDAGGSWSVGIPTRWR